MRCDECRFWVPSALELNDGLGPPSTGECHRYPVVFANGWRQPITDGDDWCGEFQSKEPKPYHDDEAVDERTWQGIANPGLANHISPEPPEVTS